MQPLLDNVPLLTRQQRIIHHDGAPSHFSLQKRVYLNATYPNTWIRRGGPHPWLPKSPVHTTLDITCGAILKVKVS